MSHTNLAFLNYQSLFLDESLDLTKPQSHQITQTLNEITSIYVNRLETDIWQVNSEFEFALIMYKHQINYKLQLPKNLNYPINIQIVPHKGGHEAYVLDLVLAEVGAQKKPNPSFKTSLDMPPDIRRITTNTVVIFFPIQVGATSN